MDLQATRSSKHGGPLHLAAEKGFEKVAAMLIEQGVPTDLLDRNGCLAVEVAIRLKDDTLCETLLKATKNEL